MITLNNIGRVLVEVADDFRECDTFAEQVFQGMSDDLKESPAPQHVPPSVSEDDDHDTGSDGATPSGPYLPGEVG